MTTERMKTRGKKVRKTIVEWFKEGVTRLRLPIWNEWAYVEIKIMRHNLDSIPFLAPWAYLYDIRMNGEAILVADLVASGDLYEKWEKPNDYEKRKAEIYGTSEKTGEEEEREIK